MSRYDANDLKSMLAGAQTLQSLSGDQGAGLIGKAQAELGVQAPVMAPPAPQMEANAGWNPVLRGPEV